MPRPRIQILNFVIFVVGISPFYLNGFYNHALAKDVTMFWLVEIASWIALPVLCLFLFKRFNEQGLRHLGYNSNVFNRQSLGLLVFTTVIFTVAFSTLYETLWDAGSAVFPDSKPFSNFDYSSMIPPPGPQTGWLRLAAICYFAMTAGIVEEFYYRAVLRKAFGESRTSTVLFVLSSSVLFAGAHWEGGPATLIATFLSGLIFGTVFVATKNIWPCTIAHVWIDF